MPGMNRCFLGDGLLLGYLGDLSARRLQSMAKTPRGRPWAPPKRKPDSGANGTLTRDALVLQIQKLRLAFLKARQVVDTIFDEMTRELRYHGTVTVPPLGTFGRCFPRPTLVVEG